MIRNRDSKIGFEKTQYFPRCFFVAVHDASAVHLVFNIAGISDGDRVLQNSVQTKRVPPPAFGDSALIY